MTAAPDLFAVPRNSLLRNAALQQALAVLLEGFDCAQDLRVSPWDFSTEAPTLLALGCTPHLLRWLVRKGYAEQAPQGRERRHGPQLRVQEGVGSEEVRFVLTELGASVARGLPSPPSPGKSAEPSCRILVPHAIETPVWNPQTAELWFRGRLVKRFRNAASNQRAILDAFQDRAWPERVTDPLPWPERKGIKLKARLHDAIKNLNRDQKVRWLHFYGTDAGRGVGWRPQG
jgi:hypothetical protein